MKLHSKNKFLDFPLNLKKFKVVIYGKKSISLNLERDRELQSLTFTCIFASFNFLIFSVL